MKLIPLTQGQSAQVDDWNHPWLSQWKWCARKTKSTYYAVREPSRKLGKRKLIQMHRLILNTPDNMEGEHQDHNGLNNQEFNLRNATRSQNKMNVIARSNTKYLGVSFTTVKREYGVYHYISARIKVNGKPIFLGNHKTIEAGAHAYDKAAKKYFGKFANLNFK